MAQKQNSDDRRSHFLQEATDIFMPVSELSSRNVIATTGFGLNYTIAMLLAYMRSDERIIKIAAEDY